MAENRTNPPSLLFGPTTAGEEFHLSRWIDVVKRRRALLLALTATAVGVALVLYAITPRSYLATTVVQIDRRAGTPMSVDDVVGTESFWDAQSFYPTQFALLRSRGLAERTVTGLRLADDPAFNPRRASFGPAQTADERDLDALAVASLAHKLQDGLSVTPMKDTRLVEISFAAPTPELAARVANGVAQAYIEWGIENRDSSVSRASSFFQSQIESLKQEIKDREAKLQAYSRSTDIVALDPQSNVTVQRLEALNKDYTAAMSDRISREATYRQLANGPEDAVADTLGSGVVGDLRGQLMKLEQEYASKLSTYKPDWPAMVDLRAEIDKSKQNLTQVVDETVSKARDAARAQYQMALHREQALAAELARQKAEAMQLNSAAVEYNNLKVEVSTRRTLLDELLRRQSEADVASHMQGPHDTNVVVVDRALPPGRPYRPSLFRNLSLGVLLGLGFGIGAVLLSEHLDRTIKTADDAERALSLPVLAVIPDVSEGRLRHGYYGRGPKPKGSDTTKGSRSKDVEKVELVAERQPRLAVSETYRSLRTALLLSSADDLQVLLVTSPGVGDGKTATSGNLAVVLAQLDRRVLLIDADLRKPRHHEIFSVSNRVGLVSVLTRQAAWEESVVATRIDGLWLLPAGPVPPNPAELLASDRMEDFITTVRERFDYVVIDSPPVLPVADATILSSLADGVTVCVGSQTADRGDARDCLGRLTMVDAHLLGVVVNRFREPVGRYRATAYQRYQSHIEESASAAEAPSLG